MATNAGNRQKSLCLLKEGFLLKRQRGQKLNADLRKLRFQQRFIQLSQTKLEYFIGKDRKNSRGSILVKDITIVERVPDVTFEKYFCFQTGNEKEVMYFSAKSEKERDAWIEAIRIAALTLNGNTMLSHYHTGAYGQVDQSKWSCCGKTKRDSTGCQRASRPRDRAASTVSATSSKGLDRETTSSSFASQSLPGPSEYLYQDESSYYRGDTTEDDFSQTAESPTEVNKSLGRLSKFDVQSIDSGLGMQAIKHYGSRSTVASFGEGLSPLSSRKVNVQSSTEFSLSNSESENTTPEPNSENWTLLRDIDVDKSASIVKAVFRDAETLITAYVDDKQYIQIATANVINSEEDGNVYMTAKSIGSIDTWRKYLAVGFPKLQLVDTSDWTWKKTLLNGEKPHHCAFKPDGSLLSAAYDSHFIDVWPHVESDAIHDADSMDTGDIQKEAQIYITDAAHIISSLSVSPNRKEPWFAVGLRMTDNDSYHVYIGDYNQYQQIKLWQQRLDHSEEYMHRDSKHVTDVHTDFSHDGRQLAVGYSSYLKVFDPQSRDLIYSHSFPDASTTSLSYSPTSAYLSVGLSSGKVKVFGKPLTLTSSSSVAPFTLPMSESPAASVTSLTYSRDCQTLAVGKNNSALNLWNVPIKTSKGNKPDFVRKGTLNVDSSGITHELEDDAITISIPQGAIPQDANRKLNYGVFPHGPFGPFKFQQGVRPVSAILSIRPEPDVGFLEPIDLTIPIFVDCENEEDYQRLAIFKACDDQLTTDDGEGVYKMDEVADGELTLFTHRKSRIQFVKVSVKHCCCYCVGEYFREDTNKANFCLVEVIPRGQLLDPKSKYTIVYCLPYNLPTCLKTIEEQYPTSAYELTLKTVRFSDDNDAYDPAIQIKFQENDDASRWKITLKDGRDKIHRKDICFWDIPSCMELGYMCESKTYPPRFTVMVDGCRATKDIKTQVMFPGSKVIHGRDECRFTISLTCENQHRFSRITSAQPVSTPHSDQVNAECAMEALQAEMYDIAEKADPLRLAVRLLSFKIVQKEVADKAKDRSVDAFYRNYDVIESVRESLKDNPNHFTLLCKALDDVYPDSKLNETYRNNYHSRSTSNVHHSRPASISSTSIKSFSSAQETLSTEKDENNGHQVNGFSENDHKQHSLVKAVMNGAAIVPADQNSDILPFPNHDYGPDLSNHEEITQDGVPVFAEASAADHDH